MAPNNNRRRRATNRSRPLASPRHIMRTITRMETGVRFSPPADPPKYSTAPWWPFTLGMYVEAAGDLTYASLSKLLMIALSFTTDNITLIGTRKFHIRPQTIRMWGLAKQPITLQPFEIIGTGTHGVACMEDMGSGINYSRLGWRFGVAAKVDPNIDDNITIAKFGGTLSKTQRALVYVQLLFQIATPPSLKLSVSTLDSDISDQFAML